MDLALAEEQDQRAANAESLLHRYRNRPGADSESPKNQPWTSRGQLSPTNYLIINGCAAYTRIQPTIEWRRVLVRKAAVIATLCFTIFLIPYSNSEAQLPLKTTIRVAPSASEIV
jgi:hypothetical protein